MLIPGNIPNIVCAGKLGIKSGEWARIGLPIGLAAMGVYFATLLAMALGRTPGRVRFSIVLHLNNCIVPLHSY